MPPSIAACTNAPHVVAVDDDPSIRQLIANYLVDHDFRVTAVTSEREMRSVMDRDPANLVVLDLRLGKEDGLQIARTLREETKLPIIILTGMRDEADRVMGLELGADDYLTKPFSPRELLARIRALLRRARMHETVSEVVSNVRAYRFNGWELNVRLGGVPVPAGGAIGLRNARLSLLLAFVTTPQRVLSRERLLELSRLHNAEVYDRSIDVLVGRLRRKIEPQPRNPSVIVTERGAGYVFRPAVETVHG